MTGHSVLELVVGGVPMPHGLPNGDWCYRHAVRPGEPTDLDRQVVADFLAYEETHGRNVTVVADPELADWHSWQPPAVRPHPGLFPKQCCSHAYGDGCGGRLVCHGAPANVAADILRRGALLPATAVSGRSGKELAAASTWGEPPEFFEHVMFANGSCTAPEAVASSRQLGRDLVPTDLEPGYPPAVRFYFDWAVLATHPQARFDGIHPVKIEGGIDLEPVLVAVVVPTGQAPVLADDAGDLGARFVVVDADAPAPQDWATMALAAAEAVATT